jgi:hypothetical protein
MMPLLVSPTAKQGIRHQPIGSMMQVSWNRSSRALKCSSNIVTAALWNSARATMPVAESRFAVPPEAAQDCKLAVMT